MKRCIRLTAKSTGTYDSAGRVTDMTVKDGTATELEYAYGNLDSYTSRTAEVSSPDGEYSAAYTYYIDDEKDRIHTETHEVGSADYTTIYTYDDEDRVTKIATGSYTMEIGYDEWDRIEQTMTKLNGQHVKTYYYEYEYDAATQLRLKMDSYKSGCQTQFDNPMVTYDSFGRITDMQNSGDPERRFEYAYDSAGRLTEETYGYEGELTYTYDNDGNISTVRQNAMETQYQYTNGRLTFYISPGAYYTFSYDGMGNPTTYKNSSLSWTRGRMLKSGTQKGNSFEYKYDAENLRYEKTVGSITTRYYYNAGQLQAEERGDEFIYYLYGIEGITGMIYNGQYYFYKKNVLGDVTETYNSNGSEVASYDYDAWGNVINKSGTMADVNPIRYRSYYYDSETGFYYLNTRYYDPEIRRFVNADNYELLAELAGVYGQVNLYNYCNNNPVMYVDPDGEAFFTLLIAALVGGAVSGGTTALSQWFTTRSVDWGDVGISALFGAVGGVLGATGIGGFAGQFAMQGALSAGETLSIAASNGAMSSLTPLDVAGSFIIGGFSGAVSASSAKTFRSVSQMEKSLGKVLGRATGPSSWLKIWANKSYKYRKVFLYPTIKDGLIELGISTGVDVGKYWGGRLIEYVRG